MAAPNEGWSADFTGHFKTGDGRYCYPLTIADGYRRFLLGCEALSSTRVQEAKPVFRRVFKAFGLPQRLRTDHGVPFATHTLGRLSQLSAAHEPKHIDRAIAAFTKIGHKYDVLGRRHEQIIERYSL